MVKQQEISAQLAKTMLEMKIIEEEWEGNTTISVTDIKSLVTYKAQKFPILAAEVILLAKLHPKYLNDLEDVRRQLFLVAM